MQVLLIGKRAKILNDVANRLRTIGWTVTLTNNLDMQHLLSVDAPQFSVVAFGRALTKEQKETLTRHYKQQNGAIVIVEGLAPIPELITYQILAATNPITGQGITEAKLAAEGPVRLHIKAFRLNWLYQLKTKDMEISLTQNNPAGFPESLAGFPFVVFEMNGRYSVFSNKH